MPLECARQLRRNRVRLRRRRWGRHREELGSRLCRSRVVRAGRLHHQGPSPTMDASSTAAPAASSTVPDKAPSVNDGHLNLQILQHGETMQHLLEASQIIIFFLQGGFTNYIEPNMSQQFNLVGEPSQFASFRPPWTMQEEELSTPISARDNTFVNIDSGDEAPRTEKRIFWTQEEDVRMMSSWLLNSTNSIVGADRKNEQYWTDVEATYNETTPSQRSRNAKQIKDRFHKVNKWTDSVKGMQID